MSPNNAPRSTFSTSAAVQETMKHFPGTQQIGFQFNPSRHATKDGVTPGKTPPSTQAALKPAALKPEFASNVVEGPPSIVELARALNVDNNGPQYMFEYVYNNIDWEPGWGVQKGALGTICDGMGNAFDQSLLLANLLRQSGFTANIVMGTIRLLDTQYEAWWNVPDIWGAQSYCLNEYIPIVTPPTWNGTQYYMDISHVWVEWVDGSTTYYFDPCMKTYTRKTGLTASSLASAMGYVSSTFLSDAESGATIDGSGNFVQNMNRTNIRSDLTTFSSNLVSYINGNTIGSAPAGTATVDDVLGGQTIVPVTLPVLNTSLGYEAPGDTPTVWTGDVPTTYKPTIQVQFPNWNNPNIWDFTWSTTSDQLACTRLTLWYSNTLVPSLYLNGTAVATGLAQPSGTYTSIYLTVEHPAYAASNYPQSYQQYYQSTWTWWQSYIYAGDYYLIGNAWGNLGRGQLDYHQTQAAAAQAAGDSSTSEALLGERLAITFFQWTAQNSRVCDLVNRIMSCHTMYSHQIGIIGFNDGGDNAQRTDLGGVSGSSDYLPNSSDYATETSINDTILAMHGVALEAATCAQMNGLTPGISATTVLDAANRTAVATIGGTVTVGNTLTITVHDSALSGGTKSDSYTVITGDTLTSIATGLASAINGDTSLSAIGVSAISSGANVYIKSMSVNQTTYTSSTSGGATETITIAFEVLYNGSLANWNPGSGFNLSTTLAANGYASSDLTNIYNSYINSGTAVATIGGTVTVGDVLTITVHNVALSGGTQSDSYTVITGDTLDSIATGLANAINADSSLSAIGVSASSAGAIVFLFSTSVNLTTYTSSTSSGATETITIAYEDQIVIPGYPTNSLGSWTGYGYWAYPTAGAFGIIDGAFKGGGGQPGPMTDGTSNSNPGLNPSFQSLSTEPIGLFTGDYFYSREDMTVGSQKYPFQLSFKRFYSSRNQYINGPLGLGWMHNLQISATVGSDGFLGMGDQFAIQGAASIAELYICTDLFSDTTRPITKLVTATLSDSWWIDQLVGNTVLLSFCDGTQTFIKQPNGSYTAPAVMPSALTLSGGLYTLSTPQGIKYNFNSSGQIATWVNAAGMTVTYSYSGGKLASVSNGLGRTLTLNYTGDYISGVTDGNGRSVTYFVDGSSDLTSFTDANSNEYTYAYDQPGRMTKFFKPQNPTVAYVTNVYDSLSRIKSQSNALNQQWMYFFASSRSEEHDPLANATARYFNRFGSVTRCINAAGYETDYLYDGLNRAVQETLPEGNSTLYTLDANNNALSKTLVAKPGSGLSNIVTNYTYDPTWANVKTLEDPNGNTTAYSYDPSSGNLLSIERPEVGGLTPTMSFTYNARGQIETITDETNIVTEITYDASTEKILSIVQDYGTGSHFNLTFQLSYDSVGNVNLLTDPNGNETSFVFDNERKQTQKTAPTPFSYITNYGYDANNNVISCQRQTGISSTPWQTFTWSYSASDKQITFTDSANRITSWNYDNKDRLASIVDAMNHRWQYAYDVLDRIYQTTDPTNTVSDTRLYTQNSLLASMEDAKSNTTQITYDGLDRLYQTTYPDTTFSEYQAYDSSGNVLTYATRSGNTIVNTYDALNRLSTKAPEGEATVTFGYDLASRLLSRSTPIVSGDPSTGTFQRVYDTAGRLYQEEYPDGKEVTIEFDSNGNATQITYPDGFYVTRNYDQLNRLTKIYLNGSSSPSAQFTYDQLSRRTNLSFANGASVTYSYESAVVNDLTSLTHGFSGGSVTFSFGYNQVHQIISSSISNNSYTWHPPVGGTVTYGSANVVNQYSSVAGQSYSYNGNGCLTGNGTWTYGYDTENHLTSASETGTSVAYVYDPFQRQAQKSVTTTGTTKTRYIYWDWQRICDYDGTSGDLLNRYIYADKPDEPLIQVTASGTTTFYHVNQQSSVIAVTNSSGSVIDTNEYGPFGETSSVSGTTFGFTGQRYDSDTGMYYYKHRYYNSSIARFLQPDPIGYGGGLNSYAYVNNSPLRLGDWLGLVTDGTLIAGAPVSPPNITSPAPPPGNPDATLPTTPQPTSTTAELEYTQATAGTPGLRLKTAQQYVLKNLQLPPGATFAGSVPIYQLLPGSTEPTAISADELVAYPVNGVTYYLLFEITTFVVQQPSGKVIVADPTTNAYQKALQGGQFTAIPGRNLSSLGISDNVPLTNVVPEHVTVYFDQQQQSSIPQLPPAHPLGG